ncbi:MAG: hypothetical protein WHT28_07640, partial [Fimbriimonadales bacterium]
FLLAVMGAAGMIAAGVAGPSMGRIYDEYTIRNLTPEVRQIVVVDGRYSPEKAAELRKQAEAGDPTAQEQVKVLDQALREGAAMTFRVVAILPAILVVLFGAQFLYYRARGGYRPVSIDGH